MMSLDHQSLEEQTRLVSRYVAGDLSRSERAEFEAWLVAAPELAAEVEMERRLRRGIASAARRGWLRRDAVQPAGNQQRWRVAMAASLVLALMTLGLSLVLGHRNGESPVPQTSAAVRHEPSQRIAARIVRLGLVRGVINSPDVEFTRADAPAELKLEPDVVVLTCEDGSVELECAGGAAPSTPQYPEYEVDLVNRRDSTLAWRSARQVPVAHSQLSFTLRDPGALSSGDYDLIVRGHSPDHEEVVARFWLRVTAQ
jgi:ferric-dicitrate binding protein FerR (iron transport regulator)